MTAADLRILTVIGADDPLGLWKFAKSRERASTKVEITSTSILDEYQIYRTHHHSFYVSDEKAPDVLSVAPGTGFAPRNEASERFDPHAVSSFNEDASVEVWLLSGKGMPLYIPPALAGKRVAIVVEGLSLPVWIVGPSEIDGEAYKAVAQLAEAIAYWFWQFGDFLKKPFSTLGSAYRRFCIFIQPLQLDQWGEIETNPTTPANGRNFILGLNSR